MKYFISCLLVFLFFLFTASAQADVPAGQRAEVAHLISFVQTSACRIDRNGSSHSGEEAAAHIQNKYDYFRNKIKTTEQFIEYSATKSTMSGSYYTVRCDGQPPMRTQDWLLRELEAYRRSSSR